MTLYFANIIVILRVLKTNLMPIQTAIKSKIWLIIISGIALIFISLYFVQLPSQLIAFGLTLGRAFVAAGVIALILRLPALLDDVNNSGVTLLTSNVFLQKLSIAELNKLRAAATKHAYAQSADAVNPSLNNLDEKIANLFLEPYFHFYNVKISCKILEDKSIQKRIVTHFSFKNPKMKECDALEQFSSRVIQDSIDGYTNDQIRSIVNLEVMKDDDEEFLNYTDYFKLEFEEYSEESTSYSLVSVLKPIENGGRDFKFKDRLQMKLIETRITPGSDKYYVNRITSPTETFSIHYSFDECKVDLIGNGFGTFQTTKDGGINITKDSNSIHIQSSRWLITGNGIMIVHNFEENS